MSEDFHQQPHLSWVNIERNFYSILKKLFEFRKIRTILDSLPGHHNLLPRCGPDIDANVIAVGPVKLIDDGFCRIHQR